MISKDSPRDLQNFNHHQIPMATNQTNIKVISYVTDLLAAANIGISNDAQNAKNDWDIIIKHPGFYDRLVKNGSLGLGESYMDGWWECKDLEGFFQRVIEADLSTKFYSQLRLDNIFELARIKLLPSADPYEVGRKHYDNGNDLYENMLGTSMAYSCAYYKDTDKLDEAQVAKYELICQKLHLEKGMTIIDIGCGWGGLLVYMVEKYGVKATGLTVSTEQKKYIELTYPELDIEIHLLDYQEYCAVTTQEYDRVVSVGMFEHVGLSRYPEFMVCSKQLLRDGGLFLLHTIGNKRTDTGRDPWIDTYIFPNGKIPSATQITAVIENRFALEDWHNFGLYYEKTLLAWLENFQNSWPKIKDNYGDRFYRMWTYYLLSCAGAFKARKLELWQIVLSKNSNEVYQGVR